MIVERWHSRFHSPHPLPAPLLDDWHAGLGDLDETALAQGLAGADEWLLIRRLPVKARWRLDSGEVARSWFAALRRALEQALADPEHPDVVRYPSRRHAWADLFYRAALGDCARAWAWAEMDLLPASLTRDPAPALVLAEAVARLAREPELVWPVLRRLLAAESERAAFTALLRALPEAGWRQVLARVPRARPYLEIAPEPAAVGELPAQPWPPATDDAAGLEALLQWIARQPWLAERHAGVLAPLLAALTWPATAARREVLAERLLHAHAFCLSATARQGRAALSARQPAAAAGSRARGATPQAAEASAAVPLPATMPPIAALPEQPEQLITERAGALFWLGRVAASGALAWLENLPDAPADALPLFLGALAECLGVAPDDPARRVFVGDFRGGETPTPLAERARSLAEAWEAWLGEAAPDLPRPRLGSVCRRPGRLLFEPGWVELVLSLDSVDTRIRRLGLDLDPGWLPWLGCVVRIRYE